MKNIPDILICDCGLPFARLQGSSIVVESRHRGGRHTNKINLFDFACEAIKNGECNMRDLEDVVMLIESYRLRAYCLHDTIIAK